MAQPGGAAYAIICTDHGSVSNFDQRYGPTGGFLSHPKTEGWCEICAGTDRFLALGSLPYAERASALAPKR